MAGGGVRVAGEELQLHPHESPPGPAPSGRLPGRTRWRPRSSIASDPPGSPPAMASTASRVVGVGGGGGVAGRGEQLEALPGGGGAPGVGVDDAGAGAGDDGQRLQRPGPRRRRRRGRRGEHRVQLRHPFLGAGEVPEPAERGGQPQPELGGRGGPGPRPARPAGCPARQRSSASAASWPAPRSRASASVARRVMYAGVRGLDPFPLAGLLEAFGGVLAQRLQHAEAGRRAAATTSDRSTRRACRSSRSRSPAVGTVVGVCAHLLGRVQGPPAVEHRQPPEQHPLGVGEQLVAPVDGRAQGPLPRVRGPGPGGEQPEPVVEPGGDLGDRQQFHPRRGQFQGQREPVEPAADVRHRGRGDRVEDEGRVARRGPARRTAGPRRTRRVRRARRPRGGVGRGASGNCASPAMPSGSRLVASIRTPRARGEQPGGEVGACGDEVFAVVQHDQRVAAAQAPITPVLGACPDRSGHPRRRPPLGRAPRARPPRPAG